MEVSQAIKSSQHAVTSPDGKHIALINNNRLEIRSASTLHLLRSISIAPQQWTLRWSAICSKSRVSQRMLLWDEEHVRAWDLFDETWSATISNGSGGMGKIVNAEFGRTEDEVLIFSDFGSKVTVWLLQTRRTIEIRHPKFASAKGFGYRSNGGVFALLSRPGAQDVLTLHTPGAYALMTTTMLPTTDAQGLKWSVDGRWIVVWDTPSIGYKIYIYTADGYLYRTYSGDTAEALQGLGVKSLEWSPGGDCIAIGGHDRRVTLLSSRTFSPIMFLDHTVTIQLTEGHTVWEEQVSASSQRSYIAVSQPLTPPTASPATSDQTIKTGMSIMSFNSEGSRFATRDDTAPTTVWLWDLSKLAACAVLIQHSPVKHMSWHPTVSSLLLIQCSHDESIVYIYDTSKSAPYAIQLPLERSSGRLEAKWVHTSADKRPALTFGDSGNFLVVWPDGKDVIVRFEDDSHDESEDSLFEILTGRSPTKSKIDSTEVLVSDVLDETTEVMDDTFVGRGRWGVT